jgi:pilus assembly protein CpaF
MAGVGLPHAAVRDQVASALDVVVHQTRLSDGRRVVESVGEVTRVAGGAGIRELWTRGGPVREPAPGELARRLDRLGATVLPKAAIRRTNQDARPEAQPEPAPGSSGATAGAPGVPSR